MQGKQNLIPVESDVNLLMNQELSMFDSYTEIAFKELKIKQLMTKANIKKRHGVSAEKLLYDLFHIPFLMISTVYLFVRNQFDTAQVDKCAYYRFLEEARFNWQMFQLHLSSSIHSKIHSVKNHPRFFVIDDTICEESGKLIEEVSYVYDHTVNRCVLGFQKLILGIFDGEHFIPVCSKLCTGKTRPAAKSKASKYQKIPKSDRIDPGSPGARVRKELNQTKLEKSLSMLKHARKRFESVNYVLFDSWYCFNSFILKVKKQTGLDVICQLKNLPKPNKYEYQGKRYSLKQLYNYFAQPRLQMIKKYGFLRYCMTVKLGESDIKMKIVFVQKNTQSRWHAFGTTDTVLSQKKILEYYSQRWSIEVFFKNCKQYLNYGKEQVSNLDSIVASDALVFMRYSVLTYMSFKDKVRFYTILESNRKQFMENTFGRRLLDYFLNKLKIVIDKICDMLEMGLTDQAIHLLKSIVQNENLCEPAFADLN